MSDDGSGAAVEGPWTSILHAPKVFPCLGKRLFEAAFREHPVRLADDPAWDLGSPPVITFLIGHCGLPRLPHLLSTIRSIAGQTGVRAECIVVEQSVEPEIRSALPDWVRYFYQRWPVGRGYGRSHAFNAGAAEARSNIVVFHDNDMLVPCGYGSGILEHVAAGYEVVNLKRFVFYLTEAETERFFRDDRLPEAPAFDAIVQNLLGGGSVAVTRHAFDAIGGFDEAFVGWGGEDVDFWERAGTRRVYSWCSLPILHLWHAPQQGKTPAKDTPAMRLLSERRRIPVVDRIDRLQRRVRNQLRASLAREPEPGPPQPGGEKGE